MLRWTLCYGQGMEFYPFGTDESPFQTSRCDGKTRAGRTVYCYGNNDNC